MSDSCFSCQQEELADRAPSESIWITEEWRVALSFNSSLNGWTVVVPRRHVESLDQLAANEAAELGNLLRAISVALRQVTGCVKTYAMLFAEAEGFSHLHVHVVPRDQDLPEDRRGVGIFRYLQEEPVSQMLRNEIAVQLRDALSGVPDVPSEWD